ncbi:MAG TPA: hypothetical protein PLA43_02535 [Bryobacteraceae bacterium]|nr:hypothetical protein [Bryobacteraceae bacterium]HOL70767.1 hypothetical protein [Bryobacteraceae bacterium]HOQ44488.1 hypothetical protein [Bryobacteraceae bacterium]HPQ17215.1 hypothetical protein [Bryobacteraceae bacterium]HPU70807.1 hypothetical protein [Bryobacteraceae bacterium]
MRLLKFSIPAALLSLGFFFSATTSFATAEYTKKEKKPCTFCHVKANSAELNDAGKYYKEHKTLEGYKK